jgi:hypothetical protein
MPKRTNAKNANANNAKARDVSPWAPVANPELAAGMREIRRSNKAGTHADTRYRRARTRQAMMLRVFRDD